MFIMSKNIYKHTGAYVISIFYFSNHFGDSTTFSHGRNHYSAGLTSTVLIVSP